MKHDVVLDLRQDHIFSLLTEEGQVTYASEKLFNIIYDKSRPISWGDTMVVTAYVPSNINVVEVTVQFRREGSKIERRVLEEIV